MIISYQDMTAIIRDRLVDKKHASILMALTRPEAKELLAKYGWTIDGYLTHV